MAAFVSALYAAGPFIVMFLRPKYRKIYEEMGMLHNLPLPTKILLIAPIPFFFVFALGAVALLLWAAWKGPRRRSTNLNLGGIVGIGLLIGFWMLGVFIPLIRIQEQLEGH